jgi:Carboxypeptidase regulatory-like domain
MSVTKTRLVDTMSVLLLLVVAIGCESPTGASPPVEFTLAGDARDTLGRFLPDVRIQVLEGSHAGVSTMTDASGRYALPDIFTGTITVRAEKAGYIPVTQRGPLAANGLQWNLQFRMVLDAPAVSMTGDWYLTIDAGDSCAAVPSVLRTRTYMALVAPPLIPAPQSYVGLLRGADFLYPRTYLFIDVAGTDVSFSLDDYWGNSGSYLFEKLAPSGYLSISGYGEGSASESIASASLRGTFEYCGRSDPNFNCEVEVVVCPRFSLSLVRQ